MKSRSTLFLLTLSLIFVWSGSSMGAGFALYEWSARGLALGGGLVARADDPSALAFNPAGMTQLDGVQTMIGISAIHPGVDVQVTSAGATDTEQGKENTWYPPHAYVTWQLSDNYWLGLGTFSRFGLGTEYDEQWVGRYSAYEAHINSLSVNPNLAMKLTDELSLSVGVEAMWFRFHQSKKADNPLVPGGDPALDIDSTLEGDSIAYGLNLGLRYAPTDWLAFGASYRSEMRQDLRGDAEYDDVPAMLSAMGFFQDTDAKGSVSLPAQYMFGIMVKPMERLTLEADAVLTAWSSYDELAIFLDDAPIPVRPSTAEQRFTKNWNDVWRYQFSVEYAFNEFLDLRAGYIYDDSPIDSDYVDYLVPANDRQLFSVGTGLHWNSWTLDLAYTYLDIKDRAAEVEVSADPVDTLHEAEFSGGDAHLFSVSLGYAF